MMTIAAVFLVDRVGRRPLLLFGVTGMVIALTLLSASSSTSYTATFEQMLPSVSALLLFVGCYQISFGPISWLIVSEIFPLKVRSQAIAVATVTNFGSNFIVSLILPGIQDKFGLPATYQCFAAVGVIALVSIYFTVPETKGKTLEEIEALWH
jgi:MFS family permease